MEEWLRRLSARVRVTEVEVKSAAATLRGLNSGRSEFLRSLTLRGTLAAGEVDLLRKLAGGAPALQALRLSDTGVDWKDLEPILQRPMLSVCLHDEPLFRSDFDGWTSFAGLQGLRSLALNGCGLTSATCSLIAPLLSSCPQLHALSFARNPLSSGLAVLAPPLRNLPIRQLSLASTQLSSQVALSVIGASVHFLDLGNNALNDEFAIGLGKVWPEGLKSLLLSSNCITEVGVEAILAAAGSLTDFDISFNPVKGSLLPSRLSVLRGRGIQQAVFSAVSEIDLSWASFHTQSTEAGASLLKVDLTGARANPDVCACLSRAQHVQRVDITCCSGMRSIGAVLSGKTSLTHVRIGNNELGDEAVTEAIRAMSVITGLKEVNLSGNVFSGCSLEQLQNCDQLEVLSLASNNLSTFAPLHQLLLAQRTLVELDISRTQLNSVTFAVLATGMLGLPLRVLKASGNDFSLPAQMPVSPIPTLQEADFARCRITSSSLPWILSLLPNTLACLDLFCNPLHSAQLPLPSDLLSLNLHKCQLCDSGLETVIFPSTLRELRLGWNSLTAASIPALAAALNSLPSLVYLSLFEALLDDERAGPLISALPESLQRLDLGYTQLPMSVLLSLLQRTPPRLTWCNLVGQTLSAEVLSTLPRSGRTSFIVNE